VCCCMLLLLLLVHVAAACRTGTAQGQASGSTWQAAVRASPAACRQRPSNGALSEA
jgi:hypothetical protein